MNKELSLKNKSKAVLEHWKIIFWAIFLTAFLMDGSSAIATYQTTQHYLEREASIGVQLALIFAECDTHGVTWNDILDEVDRIHGE